MKASQGIRKDDLRAELLANLAKLVACADGERESIAVYAPFTGAQIGSVPVCNEAEIAHAVSRARKAQMLWVKRPVTERKAIFLHFHNLLFKHQEEILDLIQIETGKARLNAFEELLDVANNCRHYSFRVKRYLKPTRRKGAFPLLTLTREYHHPVGVVGIISPWNYPFTLSISDAIPALLAGNSVVLKPDSQTPFSLLFAVKLLRDAGLPEDVFQIVTGSGRAIGPTLIPAVDFIDFTGSTETGRLIASQAGSHLIKCSLELGGKNPMLVLNDAKLKPAVEGAIRGCFSNSGQLCIHIERLYVQSAIYEGFVEAFVKRTKDMKLGSGLDLEADMGSLISVDQMEKVEAHVCDAVEKGAQVLAGGQARPDIGPFFYEPTILTGITPDMRIAKEETFGPVVSVYRFGDVEEGVQMANASSYGLNASIWTIKARYGRKLAERIQSGTVNINEGYSATYGSVDSPMGGMKESGLSRRHGIEGILKYTEPQTISDQRLLPMGAPPIGVNKKVFVRIMALMLRVLRYIPGLR